MKRMVLTLIIISIAASILFVACDPYIANKANAQSKGNECQILLDTKSLKIEGFNANTKFRFRVRIVGGEFTEYRETDGETLGWFAQGYYEIELQELDEHNRVLREGTTREYITKLNNVVTIEFTEKEGEGFLDIQVTDTGVGDELRIQYQKEGTSGWTTLGLSKTDEIFSRMLQIDAGRYKVLLELYNGNQYVTGQLMGTTILANYTTTLRGKLDGGQYVNNLISVVKEEEEITGVITGETEINLNSEATFQYSGEAQTIIWYLDGCQIAEGDSCVCTPVTVGEHEIQVIAKNGTKIISLANFKIKVKSESFE